MPPKRKSEALAALDGAEGAPPDASSSNDASAAASSGAPTKKTSGPVMQKRIIGAVPAAVDAPDPLGSVTSKSKSAASAPAEGEAVASTSTTGASAWKHKADKEPASKLTRWQDVELEGEDVGPSDYLLCGSSVNVCAS